MKKLLVFFAFLLLFLICSSFFEGNSDRELASQTFEKVRILGENLSVVQFGTGKDLLLIHGTPGSIEDWLPYLKPLENNFRLTIFDRPGHGASTRSSKLDLTYNARIAAELIRYFALKNVTVVIPSP